MAKIYSHVDGKTMGAHNAFLKELTKNGAKTVGSLADSEATILFCPIVTRYETDLNSALSKLPDLGSQKLILVAMHHTHEPDYTTPNYRELGRPVTLTVDCLFHETKGLLKCAKNKRAYNSVLKELDLTRSGRSGCLAKLFPK